jgi:tRNA(Ile)-lysidine synthetase-like protein
MRLFLKPPIECTVAFSGGVDSVTLTHFLLEGRRRVQLAHVHHGTEHADAALAFTEDFARDRKVLLRVHRIPASPQKGKSKENFWRQERYAFFESLGGPVVTCHHLDDVVENWFFTSSHGKPELIPPVRGVYLRPWITNTKQEIREYAERKGLVWVEDGSNRDLTHPRNRIRHEVIPAMLKVNPGLYSGFRKLVNNTYAPQ